ncbi:MAG: potassium channel protein [Bacteroidetes bacterium]|nr:potassium channel protein [Bacteroidota bacterium]
MHVSQKGKLRYALLLIFLIIIIGTLGFLIIENFSFLDSLYMTVITVATVGFQEVHPLSDDGKIFTIFLIFTSLGTFFYSISVITTTIIDGEFRNYFKDFRLNAEIKKMENHVIVCGYGRNGKQAVTELSIHKHPFVIIEQKIDVIKEKGNSNDLFFIEGDATEDGVLLKAGIKTAKAVITSLPLDADNLFVVLSARSLNPDLIIISRASSDSSEKKLKIAGADNVVLPEKVGGAHMATLVLKPDVVEFLNNITVYESCTVNLEEFICKEMSQKFINKTLADIDIRNKTGANIIGFKTIEGNYIINPLPDTIILADTKLFVLGTPVQIAKMRKLFKDNL